MPIIFNKDGEAWNPETGFVYDEAGNVLRKGNAGFAPDKPADVVAAMEA